jgi:O-antigen ligase
MKPLSSLLSFSFIQRLVFIVFLASGSFILLLWSPNVLGRQVSSFFKIIIYTIPWFLLWPTYHLGVIADRRYRFEIILIILIIILAALNVIYSNNPKRSLPQMEDFIFTGILMTWVSMFLINNKSGRGIFNWFCCGCLVIIATVEIVAYLPRVIAEIGLIHVLTFWHPILDNPGCIKVFTLHPIPTGTLVILLSPGPIHLMLSESAKIRLLGYLTAIPCGLLILVTQKRGTILSIAAMAIFWGLLRSRRFRYLLAAALLAAALLLPFKGAHWLESLHPESPADASILHRLELYPFALHIWKQQPVLGMGLRSFTQGDYLKTYEQHNKRLNEFAYTVNLLQTFDNMIITSFVELGTLMTLVYLGLIVLIIVKYWLRVQSHQQYASEDFYRLLVLLGFAVHSMTYDSLLFPPVNWLFHVHLGILAGFTAAQEPSDKSPLIQ